jgi:DNA end-binding protein Ku
MARAIWKGHVSFGLVEIPVAVVKAEEPHEFHFNLIDRRDHARIGYQRINKNTGEPVAWDQIVRGVERDEQMVLVGDEELAQANPEASKTIEILDFVDGSDIHPAFFDRPYYLVPTRKQAARAYALLRETLARTGKVGIARVVLHTRLHLGALTTSGPALALVLLRFADELRSPDELELPVGAAELRANELEMAEQLVESMTSKWKPERYEDTWHRDVSALIERKLESGDTEPAEPPALPEPKGTRVVDLMPLLQRSLQRNKRGGSDGRSRKKARKPARAAGTRKRASRAARSA